MRLCEAKFGNLWLREDDRYRIAAIHGSPPKYRKFFEREPVVTPERKSILSRIGKERKVIQVDDLQNAPTYGSRMRMATIKLANGRTLIAVPMLKDAEVIGVIGIYRQEVRPFNEKQIALVQNFAAQAVIAIENTRLLNELRELLERQKATSEVLSVIAGSSGELEPVFETILGNATKICGAETGVLFRSEGPEAFRAVAVRGPPSFVRERLHSPVLHAAPGTGLRSVLVSKRAHQIPDVQAETAYQSDPNRAAFLKSARARTVIAVPMLKDGSVVGAIAIYRQEVRPFTDKQIELVTNFAAQAVMAIENTRLLNELRQRTDDLTQSLEQQTATSEVLKVISSSPSELEPVFQSMLSNALRICDAKFGAMFRFEGDQSYPVAEMNSPPALSEWLTQRGRRRATAGRALHNLLETKQVHHVLDDLASDNPSPAARLAGARTHLAVPMLKDDQLVGAINIFRQEVRPFTDKQIELVQNFAAQAVIAIENARLLGELRHRTDDLTESLEQQTATSEVLKVISSSPGQLEPVFAVATR